MSICYEGELAYMPRIAAEADLLLMPHCAPRIESVPPCAVPAQRIASLA